MPNKQEDISLIITTLLLKVQDIKETLDNQIGDIKDGLIATDVLIKAMRVEIEKLRAELLERSPMFQPN